MEDKTKSSMGQTVMRFVIALPAFFRLLQHFLALVKHDAQVAKRSFITLLLLYLMLTSLLTSIWIGLMGMLLLYLIWLNLSWLIALTILIILNLLLLIIVVLCILVVKNNLTFPETRQLLRDIYNDGF